MRMSIYLQTQFALSHSLSHTLSAFLQDVTYPISSTLSMSTALTRLSLSLSFTHTPTFLQEVTYPPSCTCLMHMSLHLQTKSSLSLSPVPSLLLAGSHFPTSSTLLIRISLSLALSYTLSPSCRKSFPNIFYIIDQNLSLFHTHSLLLAGSHFPTSSTLLMSMALYLQTQIPLSQSRTHTLFLSFLQEATHPTSSTLSMSMSIHLLMEFSLSLAPSFSLSLAPSFSLVLTRSFFSPNPTFLSPPLFLSLSLTRIFLSLISPTPKFLYYSFSFEVTAAPFRIER